MQVTNSNDTRYEFTLSKLKSLSHETSKVVFDIGAAGSLTEKININNIVCCEKSFEYNADTGEELVKTSDDFITSTVFNKDFSKEVLRDFSKCIEGLPILSEIEGDK